jgi:hypothetical protein
MLADKLAGMLCTSMEDVNEKLGMSAVKLVSDRKSSPICRVGVRLSLCKHTTERQAGENLSWRKRTIKLTN